MKKYFALSLIFVIGIVGLCGCSSSVVYTITYDLNGGYSDVINPSAFNENTPSFVLANPERLGYDFVGWSLHTDLSEPQPSVEVSKGSVGSRTYHAVWKLPPCDIALQNGSEGLIHAFIQTGGPYEVGSILEVLVMPIDREAPLTLSWSISGIAIQPISSRIDSEGYTVYAFNVLTDFTLTVTASIVGGDE